MSAPDTTRVALDALDAIELAEICEHVHDWLAAAPDAAASYDKYIGVAGQAAEFRRDLHRLAQILVTRPLVGR